MKKIFSLLLSLLMVISLLPMSATASDVITIVAVNIPKPVAGEPLRWHKTATLQNTDSNYTVYQNAEWYDETEKRYMNQTESFQSGHVYTVEVWLEAKEGYEFDATSTTYYLEAFVNGREAKVSKAFEYQRWAMAVVSYTFPEVKEHKEITQVDVSDIVEPKIGRQSIARPHYLKYSEGVEGYDATWYENYQTTGASNARPFTGVFAAEKTYTFEVILEAKEGYAFARKSTGRPDVTVTFNGCVVGYMVGFDGAGRLFAFEEYDYLGKAKEKIMGVVYYNIQEPVIGEKPSFKAENQREDGLYYIDTVDPNSTKYGITWYEGVGDARKMDENDTFKAGEYYYVAIKVKPIDGYQFDTDTNGDLLVRGAINGNLSVIGGDEEGLFIGYTFDKLGEGEEKLNFTDVPKGEYYYDAVIWAVQNGITNGTSATTFSPAKACSRAEVVTFLWRAKGSPAPGSTVNPFSDVPTGQWYTNAVLWAVERGITTGTGGGKFNPDKVCTRAEVVTFLKRAVAKDVVPSATDNPFADVPAGQWYTEAVLWAVEKGITTGTGGNYFSPNVTCDRGQIVTFLYRALKK